MKKLLQSIFTLLAFLCYYSNATASHVGGGELIYKWVSDSTYHVTFKLYRDCSGNVEPDSVTLCVKDSIHNVSFGVGLQKSPFINGNQNNGTPVSNGCPSYPTTCNGGNLPGYAEWWYEGNVTLPNRSTYWVFSMYVSARNASANLKSSLSSTGNEFYIRATLNNVIAQGNSSASYTVKPVPYVCINQPYSYNNGAVDIDNDSLGFEIILPESSNTTSPSSCPTSISDIPFTPVSSSQPVLYNLTNNPIPTNNTFTLDPVTGELYFVPSLIGAYALALRTTEYRNKIPIGSTMRDLQIHVLSCNIVTPAVNADTTTIQLTNGRIQDCAGHSLHFCFRAMSTNASAVLVPSDNHSTVAPGSTVSYTGNFTNSMYGCFDWTPSNADTGFKIFTITVTDSSCAPPGITEANTFTLPLYIFPTTYTNQDTTICLGNHVNLSAFGGAALTWSVLPGGAPLSSLSCTSCSNPTATPTVTTSYVVASNQIGGCSSTDTVTITVNAVPSKPLPTSNSPLCANTTMDLYAGTTANSYLWTGPAGFNSVVQNPVVNNIQVPNTGWYHVQAKNGNCLSAADSVYVTVTVTPKFPIITGNSPICSGGTINLFAQSSNNVNYNWTGPNGFTSGSQNVIIQNAGTQYSGTYNVTASYPSNSACVTAPASYTVAVSAGIFADFHFSKDSICQYDAVSINYNSGGSDSLIWSFASGIPLDTLADNPISVKFLLPGTQTVTLIAADSGCTDVVSHTIHVYDAPPSTFSAPAITCFGDPITVVSNNDFNHDVQFNWNFGVATVLSGSGEGPYALQYAQPGTYQVTLITQNPNCTSPLIIDTLLVDAIPDASITTADINNICSNDSVHFDGVAVSGSRYQWIQSRIFANDTLSSTYALVRNAGYIYLNVVDTFGCKASDSLYFSPHPCCIVSFPTAFTPNDDGKNDVFRPITIGHHDIAYFRVFNRWGQLVYSSREEQKGWDGKYNGIPLDAGDYYFTMKYRCVDGEYFEAKGEVMLVR